MRGRWRIFWVESASHFSSYLQKGVYFSLALTSTIARQYFRRCPDGHYGSFSSSSFSSLSILPASSASWMDFWAKVSSCSRIAAAMSSKLSCFRRMYCSIFAAGPVRRCPSWPRSCRRSIAPGNDHVGLHSIGKLAIREFAVEVFLLQVVDTSRGSAAACRETA